MKRNLILSSIIVLFLTVWYVSAQEPTGGIDLSNLRPPSESLARETDLTPRELVSRRTMLAQHYDLGGGLYEARLSAMPLHYRAADGRWQPIDLTPQMQADGRAVITANTVRLTLPSDLSRDGIHLAADLYAAPAPKTSPRQAAPLTPTGKPMFETNRQFSLEQPHPTSEPPTPFSLTWRPQPLTLVAETRQVARFADLPLSPTTRGAQVRYQNPQLEADFQATKLGFNHTLRLLTAPTPSQGATTLRYHVDLTVSSDVTIQQNRLLDAAGNLLLSLTQPYVVDATGAEIRLSQRLKRTAEGVSLQIDLPTAWLTDSTRQYPVEMGQAVIVPRVLIPNEAYSVEQAASIWECIADTQISGDVLRVGNRSLNQCAIAPARALVQWDITSLPLGAVVAFPAETAGGGVFGPTTAQLYRLPISDTGGGSLQIDSHRLLVPWSATGASWLSRTLTQTWSDTNDYLATAEDSVSLAAGGAPRYESVGALYSSVGAWNTNRIFYDVLSFQDGSPVRCPNRDECYGTGNYGILYKADDETPANEIDRAFARGLITNTAPTLSVTYFDDLLGLDSVAGESFQVPRAPSPDFFEMTVPAANWSIVAIQAIDQLVRSDYDLVLSGAGGGISNALNDIIRVSPQRGNAVDFVVISPNVGRVLYPWTVQWSGTGAYRIKFINQPSQLDLGSPVQLTFTADTLVSLYEVELEAGREYRLNLSSAASSAGIKIAVFSPPSNLNVGEASIIGDDSMVVQVDGFEGGASFTVEQTGRYGFVVFNDGTAITNSARQSITVEFSVERVLANIYLPTLLRQPVPTPTPTPTNTPTATTTPQPPTPTPTATPIPPIVSNGTFETGLLNWTVAEAGGVLVASSIPNPDGNCFNGTMTAQLGRPVDERITGIPIDREVSLEQLIPIPADGTQLTVQYKVFSYDVVRNSQGTEFDYFSVSLNGMILTKEGNPALSLDQGEFVRWDSGCRTFTVDVTPYRGQQISLRFAVRNGVYDDRPTWAQLDDVMISRTGG